MARAHSISHLFGAILIVLLPVSSGDAATTVDWYSLDPSNNLRLLDDAGNLASSLTVTPAVGFTTPLFPLAGSFADQYWLNDAGMIDSLTGDATLGTFDVLVRPPSTGGFRYTLEVAFAGGPAPRKFAVGGVFPFAGPELRLSAFGAGDVPLQITVPLGVFAWDAGFSAYDGPAVWNAVDQTLEYPGGPANESAFAVFDLPAEIWRLEIEVDSPMFPQPGESISFAVGSVIPEVSTSLLAMLTLGVLAFRRHRDHARSE